MSEYHSEMPQPLQDALGEVRSFLIEDGWHSPDTYCNFFSPIASIPSVYLFQLYSSDTYLEALVAYVGMTTNLKQRMSGHEILEELKIPGYWTMRWFKPTCPAQLRDVEREYIARFDPAWNIVGRRRGMVL